jgi:hypothetical protein
VAEVLPLLYLHGLSSSDFGPALQQFLAPATACRQRRSLEHLITRLREIASRDDAPSVEDLVDYLRASGETHAKGIARAEKWHGEILEGKRHRDYRGPVDRMISG